MCMRNEYFQTEDCVQCVWVISVSKLVMVCIGNEYFRTMDWGKINTSRIMVFI